MEGREGERECGKVAPASSRANKLDSGERASVVTADRTRRWTAVIPPFALPRNRVLPSKMAEGNPEIARPNRPPAARPAGPRASLHHAVLGDRVEGAHAVLPADLLPLLVGAPVVADRHLVHAAAG